MKHLLETLSCQISFAAHVLNWKTQRKGRSVKKSSFLCSKNKRLYIAKCLNVYKRVTQILEGIFNRNKKLIDLLVREMSADFFLPHRGPHTSSSLGIKQRAHPSFLGIYVNNNKSSVMSAQTFQV